MLVLRPGLENAVKVFCELPGPNLRATLVRTLAWTLNPNSYFPEKSEALNLSGNPTHKGEFRGQRSAKP